MNVDHILAIPAEEKREIRAKAVAAGVCINCLSRRSTIGPRGGKRLCDECREKRKVVAARKHERHREYDLARMAERGRKTRELGICYECRTPLANGLYWYCADCRTRVNARRREITRERSQRRRSKAIAIYGGECFECGTRDVRTLQFHHIMGDGKNDPRRGSSKMVIDILANGIDPKIVLLCANCHAIRHWEEGRH